MRAFAASFAYRGVEMNTTKSHTRPFAERRRGIAMLIGIVVLAALFLMALPFAVFMRQQHTSSTQALHTAQARYGDHGAVNHAKTLLYQGMLQREQARHDGEGLGTLSHIEPFDDPQVDSLHEFHVTLRTRLAAGIGDGADTLDVDSALGFPSDGDTETVDGYIRVGEEWMGYSHVVIDMGTDGMPGTVEVEAEHRGLFGTTAEGHTEGSIVSFFPRNELWNVDIADQQARINLNTAPFRVVLNLLGYLDIDGVQPTDSGYPTDRQRYLALAINSYRTNYSRWSPAVEDGTYTPFQNINSLMNISVAPIWSATGEDSLTAEEFDRLRPYITVSSELEGSPWSDPISLQATITATPDGSATQTSPNVARLTNAAGIGVGSVVRFVKGGPGAEYRTVQSRSSDTTIDTSGSGLPIIPAGSTELPIASADGFTVFDDDTPGYAYIPVDAMGNFGEWIRFTGVDTSVTPPELTGITGGVWTAGESAGLNYAHMDGADVEGDVIAWEADWDGDGNPDDPLTDLDYDHTDPDVGVQVEGRHAVNINTIDNSIVLRSLLLGVEDSSTGNEIDATEAADAADALLSETSQDPAGSVYDWFDGDYQWFDRNGVGSYQSLPTYLTSQIETDAGLDTGDGAMLSNNFDTDPTNWPSVSTVPIRYNSGQWLGIDSLAVIDDRAGTPVAQSPRSDGLKLARIYGVVPPLEPIWYSLRTQQEFQNELGVGENLLSTPLDSRLPPAVLGADPEERYTDTAQDVGTVTPLVGEEISTAYTLVLEGMQTTAEFDLDVARGAAAEQNAVAEDTENTTAHGITGARLSYQTDYYAAQGSRNIEAQDVEATMLGHVIEFWIRPGDDVTSRQLLVDVTEEVDRLADTATNQVRVYLQGGRLCLRVDDEIGEGYVEARSDVDFDAGEWHHAAIAFGGAAEGEVAMFIDGELDHQMSWRHMRGGAATAGNETYFWLVGMDASNRAYQLSGNHTAGSTTLTLDTTADLPPQGMLVVATGNNTFEYTVLNATQVQITPGLSVLRASGTAVAPMLPIRRTTTHQDPLVAPTVGEDITLWSHDDPMGNGAYEYQADFGRATIASVDTHSTAPMSAYTYLGFEPADFPLGGAPTPLLISERWKVLNQTAIDAGDAFSGELSTGPLGANFDVSADDFQGELDELRISQVPYGVVPDDNTWVAGIQNVWAGDWMVQPDAAWYNATRLQSSVMGNIWPEHGYFVSAATDVHKEVYSYTQAATGQITSIRQVTAELRPKGIGLKANHDAWRRVMPLTFIHATRLSQAYPIGADDIPVESHAGFPSAGYVQIGGEIIGYSGLGNDGTTDQLLRLTSAAGNCSFPRGAYDTTMANHAAGDMVRLVPVRHFDRYRVGSNWSNHVNYDESQLNNDMCVLKWTLNPPGGGELSTVRWRLKEPLEQGQKLVILVRTNPALTWDTPPSDTTFPGGRLVSTDGLWGYIFETEGNQSGEISLYEDTGGGNLVRPTIPAGGAEVRLYFDIGGMSAYGWESMMELDTVQVQLVPQPADI